MRVLMMVMLFVAACGGANTDVKTAKTAEYKLPPETLFDAAIQVAQQNYKIGQVDAAKHRFATEPQLYDREGGRQSPGSEGFVKTSDRSVVKHPQSVGVTITPKTYELLEGSPKPRELAPDDPSLPSWIHGRVDALAAGIYEAAKEHVVQ